MDIFDLLQLIGGLSLFLFGMETMGDGLKKASGSRLEEILGKLTANVPKGVLLGTAVTAVIQSSSATTVMLVGFVNSGIMQLRQAIPVIMGANIGTTATAWLLSLTGLEGDSFLVRMFHPMSFSPILGAVAIVLILFCHNEKKRNIGMVLIGFAVLMYGMDMMSAAVKPLAEVPEFVRVLTMFSNPVLGVTAGALFTAAIQSSSASVGILQALCKTGAVSFGTAIPIIMGQNIGTCITAILSSIGANKGAKRVAAVHLSFNLIGTVVFLLVFYGIHALAPFTFLEGNAGPADIAVIHSLFNVGSTLLLLPFCGAMEKLAIFVVKDRPEEKLRDETLGLLDERFLENPGVAAGQCRVVAVKMATLTRDCIFAAMALITNFVQKKCDYVYKLEEKIDRYEDALNTYILKVSRLNPSEEDSRMLAMILHNLGDLERITDHARNIAEAAEEMRKKQIHLSAGASAELAVFLDAIEEIVELATTAFIEADSQQAAEVEPLEEVIDGLHSEVRNRHIRRLQDGICTIEQGFMLSELGINLERVADHCSNLAVCVIETERDAYDMHQYLNTLKAEGIAGLEEKMKKYQAKYSLPTYHRPMHSA